MAVRFLAITSRQPHEDSQEVSLIKSIIPTSRIEGIYEVDGEVIVDIYNRSTDQVEQMVVVEDYEDLLDQLE